MVKRRLAMSNQSAANNLVRVYPREACYSPLRVLAEQDLPVQELDAGFASAVGVHIFFLDAQVLTYFNKTLR